MDRGRADRQQATMERKKDKDESYFCWHNGRHRPATGLTDTFSVTFHWPILIQGWIQRTFQFNTVKQFLKNAQNGPIWLKYINLAWALCILTLDQAESPCLDMSSAQIHRPPLLRLFLNSLVCLLSLCSVPMTLRQICCLMIYPEITQRQRIQRM